MTQQPSFGPCCELKDRTHAFLHAIDYQAIWVVVLQRRAPQITDLTPECATRGAGVGDLHPVLYAADMEVLTACLAVFSVGHLEL
jgi:hypothetical protein